MANEKHDTGPPQGWHITPNGAQNASAEDSDCPDYEGNSDENDQND
jgi:hypothetical protein